MTHTAVHIALAASAAAVLAATPRPATAVDQYTDDFSAGLAGGPWVVESNQPLFTVDDTGGDVALSKPAGGSGGLDFVNLVFVRPLLGDFDVSIGFSGAQLDRTAGDPGNQLQFQGDVGPQFFGVVRSDELGFGHNAHVWVDPPGQWLGFLATTATAGTLRITRVGTVVTGYFDGVQLFQGGYNTSPFLRTTVVLQNNGTTDAVAVRLDDFSATADVIGLFGDNFESGGASLWSSTVP